MKCPFCPAPKTHILASRWKIPKLPGADPYYYRRRECPACASRFTTREEIFTPHIGRPFKENP